MSRKKGTAEACFRHFVEAANIGSCEAPMPRHEQVAVSTRRNSIADVVGIMRQTFSSWVSDRFTLPAGENLIRLLALLEAAGYEVTDLIPRDEKRQDRMKYVWVIALNFSDPRALAELLGFNKYQRLYDYVFARTGISEEKATTFGKFFEDDAVIEEKRRQFADRILEASGLSQLVPEPKAPRPPDKEASFVASVTPSVSAVAVDVDRLAALIMEALPLAKSLMEDTSSKGVHLREMLRKLTATEGMSNGVFELSNFLNALCSEKAKAAAAKK